MNNFIFYNIKTAINKFLLNIPIYSSIKFKVRSLLPNFKENKVGHIDVSDKQDVVFSLVKKVLPEAFPFFGTLLFIHRDKLFKNTDDFDFAIFDSSKLNQELVSFFEAEGAVLISSSYILGLGIIELSFIIDGARFDIFSLEKNTDKIVHHCPNFRKERPYKKMLNDNIIESYSSIFTVEYPIFDTSYCPIWGILLPNNREMIFESHYGKDWLTPKQNDFIDFSEYNFHTRKSYVIKSNSFCFMEEYIKKIEQLR